jgi:hypothetical protein
MAEQGDKQLLHLVIGGELSGLDSAQTRYFIVHLHRLLNPEQPGA